ncbi:MAG: hypothetical protein AAFX08_12100 [Pseudomonadota bacterium]
MQPHRRQFVIGPRPYAPNADWIATEIDGFVVSRCRELPTRVVTDADGARHALLGRAIESRSDRCGPADALSNARTADIQTLYAGWAGRWALFSGGALHLDASGLLGCYYGKRDGAMWATSSPALAAGLVGPDADGPADRRPLRYEEGLSWVVPPRSRISGVKRLLASQVLDLHAGTVTKRPLLPGHGASVSPDQTIDDIVEAMATTLSRLAETALPLWLGLSAGYDSRTVLALCRKAGAPVRTFTRIAPRMSVADIVLPPALAAQCGVDHVFLKSRSADHRRRGLAAEHAFNHLSDGDALPFLRGERDELSGLAIGGHAFEMFSGDYGPLEPLKEILDTQEHADRIAAAFGYNAGSPAALALKDWITWAVSDAERGMDWRDRFFIEQDNGGWLSAKEQLYDLNAVERFPVLNAARNYALLLSLPDDLTDKSKVQLEIIRRTAPDLLDYPFNPPDLTFGLRRLVAAKAEHLPAYMLGRLARRLRRIAGIAAQGLSSS